MLTHKNTRIKMVHGISAATWALKDHREMLSKFCETNEFQPRILKRINQLRVRIEKVVFRYAEPRFSPPMHFFHQDLLENMFQ